MRDLAQGRLGARVRASLDCPGQDPLREDLDGICDALNTLGEELQATVVSRNEYERALRELAQAQTQLVHAAKLAAIGQLAAGVAHELNQPLQIIALTLDELRDAVLAGDQNDTLEFLDLIEAQVTRGGTVVGRLLTFSRKDDAGGAALISINDVVTKAMGVLRAQCAASGIQIEERLDPNICPIPCKGGELLQVVANLVINARDALLDTAAPVIVVQTFSEDNCIGIEVSDNGPGIAGADLERIFEPFYTTKSIGVGTGLGLSIVHGIVDRHGGTIEVHSELGHGARLRVVLPK
ncbi:sensor histidine kinase [Enhygromyxa salina]|uniref:histidine kinase n=1 Tax=Enhygromyxa salina TaxID=215803 RepID=A0A2S9XQV7_9BACT|nr:ATP-binding protein [Enhygromyxa salina]PRP95249.1 Sensor protein ZraS [Enhygromyxa salina]